MKEIRLSFEVSVALKQTDIHGVEEELLRMREELFLEVLRRVMVEIEQEALKELERCESCGSILVKNGQESKKIKTLVGTVKIKRVRLRCPRCQEDSYPLDKVIGLGEGERMTLGVKERALWAAVELSYEKTSQFLKKFTGLEVSRKKIHSLALEEGKRIEQWEENRRAKGF